MKEMKGVLKGSFFLPQQQQQYPSI